MVNASIGEKARSAGARSVETTARTVDEAVANALRELGVGREKVRVDVLHAGSPGRLLGFGAEPARVRVTMVDAIPLESASRAAVPVPAVKAPAEPATVPKEDVGEEEARAEEDAEDLETEDGAVAPPRPSGGEAELARIMLVELLNRMQVREAQVEVAGHDPVTLNIRGQDVADLIGRRGEHLRALQFILSLMLNKQLHQHVRVVVDVDGYRQRREELLRSMAQRFAHRVRATREPMQLEAMPPNERRIIHLTLAEDPDVMTESTGEGETRRVVIKPRR